MSDLYVNRRRSVTDPWGGAKDALNFYATQQRFKQRLSLEERGHELRKQKADTDMRYAAMQEQRQKEAHQSRQQVQKTAWFQGKLEHELTRLPESQKEYSDWYASAMGPDANYNNAQLKQDRWPSPEEVRNMKPEQYNDFWMSANPKIRESRRIVDESNALTVKRYGMEKAHAKEMENIRQAGLTQRKKLEIEFKQKEIDSKLGRTRESKAADAKAMISMVDKQYGTWDDVEKKYTLTPKETARAQATSTRAQKYYDEGLNHTAAVAKALSEDGKKPPATVSAIQSFLDETEANAPGAAPTAADGSVAAKDVGTIQAGGFTFPTGSQKEEGVSKTDLGVGVGRGVAALGESAKSSVRGAAKKVEKWGEKKRARFELGGKLYRAKGMKKVGNIDPSSRPVLRNKDGSISTEATISIGTDQGEVLIPTIINGKKVSEEEAMAHYKETGEHLGIFRTVKDANRYAKRLSEKQGRSNK